MAYTTTVGSSGLGMRAEVVDALVKQVAAPSYKFKQACATITTTAWKNTFFREDPTVSSGVQPFGNFQLPRGANFSQSDTNWQEVSVRIVKFGVECNIPWEDIISGTINVQARTVIRRTQEITKAVDDFIWTGLTESLTPTNIQSFSIGATSAWDTASCAIINDLMHAARLISVNGNYDTSDLMAFVNPYDKQNIMNYLVGKGSQFPSIATGIAENGRIGVLAGITLVEAASVTASWALVLKPKTCATINQLVPLTTATTEEPLKSWRVRIAEELSLELTDPKAICAIRGTQAVAAP